MPRQAREKDPFGIYYISQKATKGMQLFDDGNDRDIFLKRLEKTKKKYGFILKEFCLSQDRSYELILDMNGGDVSKVMKSLNISYAMYKKSQEKLFTERYYSKLLPSDDLVEAEIKKMKAKKQYTVAIGDYTEDPDCLCNDDVRLCKDCMSTPQEAEEKLRDYLENKGMTKETLLANKTLRNEAVVHFRRNSTLSLKQLGILFGGISESAVCKILSNI